ncbi:hypothetical protein K3888_12230 [Dietzia aurantiaca]|uniref:hypothetical protein n=1 Tax=Dietzia aurantiaca TaxID=983873 RepID=UPI001E4FE808|nr:hypothetical protein [Dietzia aurantiaca]MCD2263466.1 hypothetical protein [Dietzia aurantiaca]
MRTRDLTIAVLGARDSAAPAVAAALRTAALQATTSAAGTSRTAGTADTAGTAGPPGDGTAGGRAIRVLVDASPSDRPDAAVVVVDAVCPVRPDDVEVARGVASRLPLAVALAGRADTCTAEALSETVDVTTRRLADAGVHAPVHVVDEGPTAAPAAVLAALLEAVRSREAGPVAASPAAASPAATSPTATVDWLLARRTETITTRSQALRQDVQALRMEILQDLQRSLRDLGGRAREDLAAAPRSRVDTLVEGLAADADAAVAGAVDRADRRCDTLVVRHLGVNAPTAPRIPAPTSGVEPSRPPRSTGEELLVMLMGAAGGTGVGRMLLSPLAEMPGMSAMIVPLALLCGLALGWTTVTVRRTQALRTHTVAAVGDRLAALRGEAEQALGSRILAAEAIITDGFAHDPGPRVADLERRIRRLRSGGTTPATTVASTVAEPIGAAPAPPVPAGSPSA